MLRLSQVNRVMMELEACRRNAAQGDWGVLLGELDWLEELHDLLYGGAR